MNRLDLLKKRFMQDLNMFNKPPFDLISEVSLVKLNVAKIPKTQDEINLLEDYRKNVTERNYVPKDKFGFMRFKSLGSDNEVDLET